MFYVTEISTPAGTTEANAKQTKLKLRKGVIHYIEVDFPPGCYWETHCTINYGVHQIFPTNTSSNIAGDARTVSARMWEEISKAENVIDIYTWNDDELNAHSLRVGIGLLDKEVLEIPPVLLELTETLKRLVWRLGG